MQLTNWLSYFAIEDIAWLGTWDIILDFRREVLGLAKMNQDHASHAIYFNKVSVF